jgi:hypothetical protein
VWPLVRHAHREGSRANGEEKRSYVAASCKASGPLRASRRAARQSSGSPKSSKAEMQAALQAGSGAAPFCIRGVRAVASLSLLSRSRCKLRPTRRLRTCADVSLAIFGSFGSPTSSYVARCLRLFRLAPQQPQKWLVGRVQLVGMVGCVILSLIGRVRLLLVIFSSGG